MSDKQLTVALAGNPNAGKTTVFNAVTGQRQHVGNYPGVTVEKKEGWYARGGVEHHVVDLPGTYSLTAYSLEERVARNFLIDEKPDVVVDIVDCSNLERNLYLAVQFMEMGVPLVLAFNKSDLALARGYRIHVKTLSQLLGVPIVSTVAHKGKGIDKLLDAAARVAADPEAAVAAQGPLHYGRELEPEIDKLAALAAEKCRAAGRSRWVAMKLLEDDPEAIHRLRTIMGEAELEALLAAAGGSRRHILHVCGDNAEIILADRRYGLISGACQEAVRTTVESRHQFSDRVDAVVTNRIIGLPLFLLLTLAVFQVTFWLGAPLSDGLDAGKDFLAGQVAQLWPKGADSILRSLIVDAVIGGVGAVIVFVPMIFILFLAIAVLEDTGYMARAAFVMDRLMHKIGLHGKSFVPMLIGFGCSVPAIMATRTLESRRDRLTTMLVVPLFSCSARLPIYVLILGAFFPSRKVFSIFGVADVTNQALLLMGIYLIGIVLAVLAARVLRSTLLRGEVTPFVMELPPYRLPTVRGAMLHAWDRTWMFLRKAGTVILAAVIILWAMSTFPRLGSDPPPTAQRRLEHSIMGRVGKAIAPVFKPCGFDWKIATSLIGAFAAKEVFVSQMGMIYAVGEADQAGESLPQQLQADYSPLQGFCIMLYCLVSMPCVATVAVIRRESGSWKWALLAVGYLTALAWVVAAAVYQAGSALGIGVDKLV